MKITWDNLVLYSIGTKLTIGHKQVTVYGLIRHAENEIHLMARDEDNKTHIITEISGEVIRAK